MPKRSDKLYSFATLASFSLIVGALYWGRPVLMPLAMAILLSFILGPLVTRLRRLHLPHALAVAIVVVFAFSLLGGFLVVVGNQFNNLASELPQYEDNIHRKARDMRLVFKSEGLDRARKTIQGIRGEFNSSEGSIPAATQTNAVAQTNAAASTPNAAAVSSKLTPDLPDLLTRMLGSVSSLLVTAGLVIVLVIFILLRRDELRNRLILFGGLERREVTTRILSETGQRISRYLITYTLINTIYGTAIAIGLYFIGLPYAFLWGFFAGALRFIPYVGPWLGAIFPVMLGLAVFPGWLHPLLIVAYYVVIELTTNMVLEPIFYGRSAGVSEVALLVVLAFWAWIWGPVGLLLGTPLTVCLAVLAKHIPGLESLHLLIGDGPVEESSLIYYERLCTLKDRRAQVVVRDFIRRNPRERVFDELLLPALIMAKRDRESGRLSGDTAECVFRSIRKSIELASNHSIVNSNSANGGDKSILGVPCGENADELALVMLQPLLREAGFHLEVLPPATEYTETVLQKRPAAVCLGALPPHPSALLQRISGSLRDGNFTGPIIAIQWGLPQQKDRPLASVLGAEFEGIGVSQARENVLNEFNKEKKDPQQCGSLKKAA